MTRTTTKELRRRSGDVIFIAIVVDVIFIAIVVDVDDNNVKMLLF